MTPSLKALLTNIIDYAGMFPPAKLSIEDSLRNYSHYSTGEHSWMLRSFVVAPENLAKLEHFDTPLSISFPLSDEDSKKQLADELKKNLKQDMNLVGAELRIPECSSEPDAYYDYISNLNETIKLDEKVMLFFEPVQLPDGGLKHKDSFIKAIRRYNDNNPPAGYKFRMGGAEASHFPDIDSAAHVLMACHDEKVPFKATAGLHHPFRNHDANINAAAHGFLNVFAAAVFLHYKRISDEQVKELLSVQAPGAIYFDDEQIKWQGLSVPTGKVTLARKEFAISFGSCSFTEPVEDLQKLNLM